MKLILQGHASKSDAEAAMLNYFAAGAGGTATVSLHTGGTWETAVTTISRGGQSSRAAVRARAGEGKGGRCVKESFYKAALPLLDGPPPWGSLTGIRPAKLAAQALSRGEDAARLLERTYHVSPVRRRLALACAEAAERERARVSRRDIALYIGIPFCPTRCAYCSFVSADAARLGKLMEPFTAMLREEIALAGAAARRLGLRPVSVYLGGGTPTSLSAGQLDGILSALKEHFDLRDCPERTVEAGRPDTVTPERLEVLKRHGITRLSVNPQTFRDEVLRAIGRGHTAAETAEAFQRVRAAGFRTVNCDLIAGLPADSPAGFSESLRRLLALGPENITVHTLSVKKGSAISEGKTAVPDAAAVAVMLDGAIEALESADYRPYYLYRQKFQSGGFENTGWTRPGHENRYNLLMMEEIATVLAMGGGGVTKLVAGGRIMRLQNCKFPLEYLNSRDKIIGNLAEFENRWNQEITDGPL